MRYASLIAVLLSAIPLVPACASDDTVTIATWNLRSILPDLVRRHLIEQKPVWRNTFGPRRTTERPDQLRPTVFSADIVALQGISSLALARRLFPARKYMLVVGRSLTHLGAPHANKTRPDVRITAIAVRRTPHTRVIGRVYISAGFAGARRGIDPPRRVDAGIAVRVRLRDRAVWVLSVDLIDGCRRGPQADKDNAKSCEIMGQQFEVIADWLKTRREGKQAAIVAGNFNRNLGHVTVTPATGSPWQLLDGRRPPPQQKMAERPIQKPLPQKPGKHTPPSRMVVKPADPPRPPPRSERSWWRQFLDRLAGKPTVAKSKPKPKPVQPAETQQAVVMPKEPNPPARPARPTIHRGQRVIRFPAHHDGADCRRTPPHTLDYILASLRPGFAKAANIEGQVLQARRETDGSEQPADGSQPKAALTQSCPLLLRVPSSTLNQMKVYQRPLYEPEKETPDPLLIGRPVLQPD